MSRGRRIETLPAHTSDLQEEKQWALYLASLQMKITGLVLKPDSISSQWSWALADRLNKKNSRLYRGLDKMEIRLFEFLPPEQLAAFVEKREEAPPA